MIILGIDPGMAVTGYGIIKTLKQKNLPAGRQGIKARKQNDLVHVSHGVIRTPAGMEIGERLKKLRLNLRKIIKEFCPECMVIEQHFFGRNSKTAMIVGQARGVIIMTAAEFNLASFEYQSLSVKKLLTNDGHAEKMKMQKTVKKILRLKKHPTPNDAADALAIAICHSLQ